MDAYLWLSAGVGAGASLAGAGMAYLGVRAGIRQRQLAEARAEWGRRLDLALRELAAVDNPERRAVGREILLSLTNSELGSATDRALADQLAARDRDRTTGPAIAHRTGMDETPPTRDNSVTRRSKGAL